MLPPLGLCWLGRRTPSTSLEVNACRICNARPSACLVGIHRIPNNFQRNCLDLVVIIL
jgi:hypothetical protein